MMKRVLIATATVGLGMFLLAGHLPSTTGIAAGKQAAAKGDATKGKETFEQCAVCHSADSPEAKMGPSLQGLFKRKAMKSGKPINDANVMAQINAGGNGMPAYADQLSPDEKANLMAYLHTL